VPPTVLHGVHLGRIARLIPHHRVGIDAVP
jgi:hypothetical protein